MKNPKGISIEIVCGIDENYAPHLSVLLASIAQTNKDDSIRVHILHDGVGETLRARIAASAKSLKLAWYEIVDHQALGFEPLLHISRATYLRLTMEEVLPADIERILYLDVDMVVNDKLRPLWETELEENLCAAVTDPGVDVHGFTSLYALPPATPRKGYFNGGVILFDLAKIRRNSENGKGLFQAAIELLASPDATYEFADQDALNIVFWNKWLPLDPSWNFQRKFLYDDFTAWNKLNPAKSNGPKIIHFTEGEKPWKKSEWHPFAWLYIKYLKKTEFTSEILENNGINFWIRLKWKLKFLIKKPNIFY
jgi:lipopolysaccharide biosynthesis glycosyltransferase